MRICRAQFKYSLRYCKKNEDSLRCDKLAEHMSELNMIDFWKQVKRMSSSKSIQGNCIDGVSEEVNIADRWKEHYNNIFNCIENTSSKDSVLSDFMKGDNNIHNVSAIEVDKIIHDSKKGKSAGPDRLTSESLIYANFNVSILLSLCFNAILNHSYIPMSLLESVIIPLVKNKCGNLSDINNYRPIAIANVISKIFESVLLTRLDDFLWTNENQFGFKPAHSTDMSVYILHDFILKS